MPGTLHLGTDRLRGLIGEKAKERKLDPAVVEAVVLQESSGHPHSHRFEPAKMDGSFGLMQVMEATMRHLATKYAIEPPEYVSAMCDPAIGLFWGCLCLADNLDGWVPGAREAGEFSKILAAPFPNPMRVALARYNGGRSGNPYKEGPKKGAFRNIEYVQAVEFKFVLVTRDIAGA